MCSFKEMTAGLHLSSIIAFHMSYFFLFCLVPSHSLMWHNIVLRSDLQNFLVGVVVPSPLTKA